MTDFKEQAKEMMTKYSLDPKMTQEGVKNLALNSELAVMEKTDQEKNILQIVDIVGKAGVEFNTGFMIWKMTVKSKKKLDDILERFKGFVEKKEYQSFSKGEREKMAANAVKAGIAFEAKTQTKVFDVVVLGKSTPKLIKMRTGKEDMIASIGAYCTMLGDNVNVEPFYRTLMFWRDQGKQTKKLIVGHHYEADLAKNSSAESAEAWGPTDKTEWTDKGKFQGGMAGLIDKFRNVQNITLSEVDFQLSKGKADYRGIHVIIVGRQIFSKSGGEVGMYFVADDTVDDMVYGSDDSNPTGGFTVFTDPQNMIYGEGSEVCIVGTISEGHNKDGSKRTSMNGDAVIPILAIPVDIEPVESEDEVDMNTADDTVVDPAVLEKEMEKSETGEGIADMFGQDES